MIKITSGMGRNITGTVAAIALAALFSACAKQESVLTAQADTHTQAVAQTEIPEVIVTASRDSAIDGTTTRHE